MTKEDLKEWLLYNLEDAKLVSGGKQIACRCHNCDDHARHLYIGPFDDREGPLYYECKRCPRQFRGVVNKEFLDTYQTATVAPIEVNDINKSNGPITSTKLKDPTKSYNINRSFITDAPLSKQKLDHINKRLGLNLSYQDCINNKIVLNLYDIYRVNPWITKFTRDQNITDQLDRFFIGFLSRTNASLNMRNLVYGKNVVHESIDKKYINYNIFNNGPDYDFYILPTTLNKYTNIGVHIVEGPFDALGVKYNVVGADVPNQVYIAGKGKAYDKIINFLVTVYGFFNMTLNYYPDKDVSDREIERIVSIFKPFNFEQYIYRNVFPGEKDFGVPRDHITVSKQITGRRNMGF